MIPNPSLEDLIERLVDGLKETVGAPRAEDPPARFHASMWLLHAVTRLIMLIIRLQKGLLRPLRLSTPSDNDATPRGPADRCFIVPRLRGWLLDRWPETSPLAQIMAELLAHPTLQSLLAQEPSRFTHALRPLCHALALDPPEPAPHAAPDTPEWSPSADGEPRPSPVFLQPLFPKTA